MSKKLVVKAAKMQLKKESKAVRASKMTVSRSSTKSKKLTQSEQLVDASTATQLKHNINCLDLKVQQINPQSKEVIVHNKYTLAKQHRLYSTIQKLIDTLRKKQTRKDKSLMKVVDYTVYPTFEFELQGVKPDHEKCCICQFEFSECEDHQKELCSDSEEDVVAIRCGHMLHKGCLKNMIGDKKWIRCPVCSTIFGVMVGDQPPGTMTWYAANGMECDGYPGVNTTVINYSMKSGTRNGVAFDGTSRRAYLPDTPEGNEVLKLLKLAFDRKLIFTVGTSVTTGRDNCVVWNGIHHKTNTHGGSSSFGYPDPTYFQRVKLELAAKGIY